MVRLQHALMCLVAVAAGLLLLMLVSLQHDGEVL